ncbi:hypothetical protein XENORESO_021897 [Xenotaenia resolanae]|uniref:Uncharacterized protein n=1 Tax=Xenotaenia resolanae TaxID=208358 RepID=A0ABV0WXS8_9TELE
MVPKVDQLETITHVHKLLLKLLLVVERWQLWFSWRTSLMEEVGDPPDLLGHDDARLISWFRLSRTIILELCMELASVLQRETEPLVPVPVLTTLRFFQPELL